MYKTAAINVTIADYRNDDEMIGQAAAMGITIVDYRDDKEIKISENFSDIELAQAAFTKGVASMHTCMEGQYSVFQGDGYCRLIRNGQIILEITMKIAYVWG